MTEIESKNKKSRSLLLGFIFILIGFLLVANQLDIVPMNLRGVIFSWPALLVLIGVFFVSGDNKATGYILMGIGGFFLLPRIFEFSIGFREFFWPSIFIILGLVILFGGSFWHRRRRVYSVNSGADYLDDVNIFGGHDRIITSKNFKGGSVVSIFGGGKYDLRQCTLGDEKNYLEAVNIFGGSNFIVPPDWDVKVEITAIFGGFSDKRFVQNTNTEKQLIIKGVAIFGGGEIQSA